MTCNSILCQILSDYLSKNGVEVDEFSVVDFDFTKLPDKMIERLEAILRVEYRLPKPIAIYLNECKDAYQVQKELNRAEVVKRTKLSYEKDDEEERGLSLRLYRELSPGILAY